MKKKRKPYKRPVVTLEFLTEKIDDFTSRNGKMPTDLWVNIRHYNKMKKSLKDLFFSKIEERKIKGVPAELCDYLHYSCLVYNPDKIVYWNELNCLIERIGII